MQFLIFKTDVYKRQGYEAVIEDDADIIDESNYSSLLDIMKQITVYGNVMLKRCV